MSDRSVRLCFLSLLLLCRDDDPLAMLPHVSWQTLQGAKLVLQDYASGSRPLIDSALNAQG